MAITVADLSWRRSINTGPGLSQPQPDPSDSLGGWISTTVVPEATAQAIFDILSGDENVNLDIEYRCLFVFNNHATLTLFGTRAWLALDSAGGAVYDIALDQTGISVASRAGIQSERIADENTAPSGEAFSAPADKDTGLLIGDIPAQSCAPIWIRRRAQNSAPVDVDQFQVVFGGDTGQ